MSIWSFLESLVLPPPPPPKSEPVIKKMKVLDFESSDSHIFQLVRREIPIPKENQVLIKILATSVSYLDIMRRARRRTSADLYTMTDLDPVLGMECSGEIVVLGSGVTEHRVGDKVCALLSGGGYAEYVAVDSWRVLPIPNGIRADDAAAFPYTASVVWSAFYMVGNLIPNSSVMIYDAIGEFGSLAIQLAKLHGCTVFAARNLNKYQAQHCKALGADFCITYDDNLIERVYIETGGRGVDFIFDPYGYEISDNLEIIAPGGTIVLAGAKKIRKGDMNLRRLIEKRIKVVGLRFISLSNEDRSNILQEILKELWPRFERGELVLNASNLRFCLHEVDEAHSMRLYGDTNWQKILVVPTPCHC